MNKFKKKYSAFQRNILKDFLNDKALRELDRAYNNAKVWRIIRKELSLKK